MVKSRYTKIRDSAVEKKAGIKHLNNKKLSILEREPDLNQHISGYEPDELPITQSRKKRIERIRQFVLSI